MINSEIKRNPDRETMKRKTVEQSLNSRKDTKLVSRVVVDGDDIYRMTK